MTLFNMKSQPCLQIAPHTSDLGLWSRRVNLSPILSAQWKHCFLMRSVFWWWSVFWWHCFLMRSGILYMYYCLHFCWSVGLRKNNFSTRCSGFCLALKDWCVWAPFAQELCKLSYQNIQVEEINTCLVTNAGKLVVT